MPDPDLPIIPPAGVTPLGFWGPVAFVGQVKPPAILADYISSTTGDFVSLFRGLHPIDAQVITRARTKRGTGASVRNVGHLFHTFELVDEHAVQQARFECARMFADLVDRKDIRIDDVVVQELPDGAGVATFLAYTNLRTKKPDKVRL